MTNTGGSTDTLSVPLTVNGETVAAKNVTLEPDASTTVSFTHAFDSAGDYDVAIGDASVGTVHVAQAQTTTQHTTTQATSQNANGKTPAEPGCRGGFPFVPAVIVLIIVLAAVGGLYVYRSQNQ